MQIEVALDVYKALTDRLSYEGQTYSDLIRGMLGDRSPHVEAEQPPIGVDHLIFLKQAERSGFASRDLWLPDGTQLRAYYKRKEYRASIQNNVWVDEAGHHHPSPSAAARAITGTTVNGLRFWDAKAPGESSWTRLELLRKL